MADPRPSAAVFVHGIFSSPAAWDALLGELRQDAAVREGVSLRTYGYLSPVLNLNLLVRIPRIDEIADGLATFLETDPELEGCQRIALVGHSQGGLVIQRYLARKLTGGRARDLARIRGVVTVSTPNTGSQYLLSVRRALRGASLWHHPQEKELHPDSDRVEECRRVIVQQALYASALSSHTCPIPFEVCAGLSDAVVASESARWVFPRAHMLRGDHSSVLRRVGQTFDLLPIVRKALLRVRHSFPSDPLTIRTESLDVTDSDSLDDVMRLESEEFGPQAAVRKDDLRHWFLNYPESWPLRPEFLVARVDDVIAGFLMFHESKQIIVVDYIAMRHKMPDRDVVVPHRDLVVSRLIEQLRRRARELDVPIVFEVEDPRPAGTGAAKAEARIRLFGQWGARVIDGLRYLAPDMNAPVGGRQESPYLLMYARPGASPDFLEASEVAFLTDQLYRVWYRNWFSHRVPVEELERYLGGLAQKVTRDIPHRCRLLSHQQWSTA